MTKGKLISFCVVMAFAALMMVLMASAMGDVHEHNQKFMEKYIIVE